MFLKIKDEKSLESFLNNQLGDSGYKEIIKSLKISIEYYVAFTKIDPKNPNANNMSMIEFSDIINMAYYAGLNYDILTFIANAGNPYKELKDKMNEGLLNIEKGKIPIELFDEKFKNDYTLFQHNKIGFNELVKDINQTIKSNIQKTNILTYLSYMEPNVKENSKKYRFFHKWKRDTYVIVPKGNERNFRMDYYHLSLHDTMISTIADYLKSYTDVLVMYEYFLLKTLKKIKNK